MAALPITVANVGPGDAYLAPEPYIAGEAISAGKAICYLPDDGYVYLTDASDATKNFVSGIAVSSAAALDDPVWVAGTKSRIIATGATMTVGQLYYAGSAAPGSIVPFSDLTTGDTVCGVYRADTTTTAKLVFENSEIEL